MSFHKTMAFALIVALAAPSLFAKQRREPPEVWRAFAEKLEAGAFVKVTLKDQTRIKGHFVMIEGDTIRVKPKTRIPVPIRDFQFSDIDSIDRQKEGSSPGTKVLIGVVAGAGVALILAIGVLLSLD